MSTVQKMGRPTVMTEETVRKLELALRNGFSVTTACRLSGISRETYYSHVNNNSEFNDRMTLAEEWIYHRAKQVIAIDINNGNVASAKWWLERKARVEFAPYKPL